MTDRKDHYQTVKELARHCKPKRLPDGKYGDRRFQHIEGPLVTRMKYRGKEQCVVGYTWTRPQAHSMSGIVNDCVLGWGDTFEQAIEMMRAKVTLG